MTPHETPVQPRLAATVIIVRPAVSDGVGKSAGIEVFMQRRHEAMAFCPGAHVFPGGGVSSIDHDPAIQKSVSEQLDERTAAARLNLDRPDGLALYLAAARETFEEIGVLFASQPPTVTDAGTVSELRQAVEAGQITLLDAADRLGTQLNLTALNYVGHFVTPESQPIRYDARFFVAAMPEAQIADGTHGEIDFCEWIAPKTALYRWERSEVELITPTIKSLEFLVEFDSVDEVMHFVASNQTEPVTMSEADGGFYLPGPNLSPPALGAAT